jgi:transcriptional antiterminator NusG
VESAKWYIVHTFSGYEDKVKQIIEKVVANRKIGDLIQKVEIPVEMVKEAKDGKEKVVKRKIFPGYVYIKMIVNDDTWYTVRNTRGVTGFVGPEGDPTPLTPQEIENVFGKLSDEVRKEVDFKVGDNVRITASSMQGFIAEVSAIDLENGTVTVLVDFFGAKTPTELKWSEVESVL